MAAPQTSQAVRRWIMTAAVAGVTITGTVYGAGLKTDRDVNQVCLFLIHCIYLHFLLRLHYKTLTASKAGSPLTY